MVQRALLTQLGQKLTDARNRRIDLENRMHALGNVPPPIVAQAAPPRPALYTASYSTSWKRETPTFGAREDADTLLHEGGSLPAFDGESLGDMDFERWCAVAENGGIELGDLRPIRQGLVLAKAKRDALAERFGPKHPDFRAAERHVGAWKSRLQEAIGRTPQIIRQELQTAEQYERRLADIYKQEFAEAKTVDGYLLEEQQLLDSIGRVQTIHDSILTQVQQWQLADRALAEGRAGVKVRELETPALAEQVLFPPPWLLAFLCVVVGLIGGSTAITVIEHKQTRTQ